VQLDYTKSQEVIAEIEAELKQLELQTTQTEQQYLDNLNQVSQLQTQLRELDNKAVQFNQQNLALRTQGDRELQDVNREIARLKQQIEGNSQIVSTQAGCITELNASLGQVLESGTRLGYLQTTVDKPALKSLSYLAVKDGKRIKGGMTMIITPDTIQRERFGGIVGRVEQVATLPSTREGILAAIGNADIAQTFVSNGAVIEIESILETDATTASGYKWSSSQGTTDPITSGTTATVKITLEERAPITFVLPFLRELGGTN
jgi:HlyD family secretion protein